MGREVIAERLVNDMKLHFLDLIVTLREKAEDEGIDGEELDETLENTKWSATRMMQVNKFLSVHSIEDLLKLTNITTGLLTLSQVNTAEQAQSWVYKLPDLYQSRLEHQHLTPGNIVVTFKISLAHVQPVSSTRHLLSPRVVINLPKELDVSQSESPNSLAIWWGQKLEHIS